MLTKKQEEAILEILNSEKFDKEALREWTGFRYYEETMLVEEISYILKKQYGNIDLDAIFRGNDKEKMIDFLNRLICSNIVYKNGDKKPCSITIEELEEFKRLAEQTDKVSKADLSQTAPLLTTRTYMDMCRMVYDATFEWKYPEDISTAYLFCEARMFEFKHEYEEGILGIDWDSPEQFARRFDVSYHNEELFFGGPSLYIHDESACIGKNMYTCPARYGQWTGCICCNIFNKESLYQAIKMYIVLRRKQYPIYFFKYEEAYAAARKKVIDAES